MPTGSSSVFDRVVYKPDPVFPVKSSGGDPDTDSEKVAKKRRRRALIRALDIFASLAWAYAFVRVFVGDVDTWIAERTVPGVAWLLDYRFFGLLVFLSIVLLVLDRKRFWIPLYVLAFPLVLAFWKFPRFLIKRRSMTLFIGFVHMATTAVRGLKRTVIGFTLFALSALIVWVSSVQWLLWVAVAALVTVWLYALYSGARYAFSPGQFVRNQRRLIAKALSSEAYWKVVRLPDEARNSGEGALTAEESIKVVQAAGWGIIGYRGSHFWAAKLDNYRRSPAFVVFSALAVLALVLLALIAFTLVNIALYRIDPGQFEIVADPSFFVFMHYSLASMYGNETAAIGVAGGYAAGVALVAWLSAGLVLILVLVSVIFGYRNTRADQGASAEIARLREVGTTFAARLAVEYSVSIVEIGRHVSQLGFDVLGLFGWLARVDPDWTDDRD